MGAIRTDRQGNSLKWKSVNSTTEFLGDGIDGDDIGSLFIVLSMGLNRLIHPRFDASRPAC